MMGCKLCDEDINHPRSGLCKKCYSFVYYWKQRSVTQMMAYLERLGTRRGRMQRLLATTHNVRTLGSAKARRARRG